MGVAAHGITCRGSVKTRRRRDRVDAHEVAAVGAPKRKRPLRSSEMYGKLSARARWTGP